MEASARMGGRRACRHHRHIRWRRPRRGRGWPPCSEPRAEQRPARPTMRSVRRHSRRAKPVAIRAWYGGGWHRNRQALGYLAPASLWAEKNHGGVWISASPATCSGRSTADWRQLLPDPADRHRRVVVQGARELPLPAELRGCAGTGALRLAPASVIPLGLIARWALVRTMATSRAATCRAGWRSCSAPARSLASPTGAASASMPPARTGGAASSSTRSAARDRAAGGRQPCAGDDAGRWSR